MRARTDIITAILLGALFVVLYALTVPANHSEADNAFHYAWQTEQVPLAQTIHRHHLFFVPLAKGVFHATRVLGVSRAHAAMLALSMLAGGIAIAFAFLTLRRNLDFSRGVALLAAAIIGTSYGFWRYACEAEIPVVAAAPLMIAIYCLTRRRVGIPCVVVAALAAAAAVFMHVLALIPAVLALPALLMGRRRRAPLLAYILILIAIILGGYAGTNTSPFDAPSAELTDECGDIHFSMHGPSAIGNAIIGFGQTIVGGNFLFCVPPFREFMTRAFSHRLLREELLLGEQAGLSAVIVPLITLLLIGLVTLFVADDRLSVPAAKADDAPTPQPPLSRTDHRRPALICMLIWLAVHSLLLLSYQPANPEGWILVSIPFWMSIILLWAKDPRGIPQPALGTLFVLLLLHNYFGGIHLLADKEGDFYHAKSQWVLDHMRSRDIVLTADNPAYTWHLRYHSPGDVVNVRGAETEQIVDRIQAVRKAGGHVFAMGDVFTGPDAVRHTTLPVRQRMLRTGEVLQPSFARIRQDDFGGVWIFRPKPVRRHPKKGGTQKD
ncbi:MAG: hypothetical protein HN383_01350 [Verrucomicrobia bacterium]|nr:hypothetical protein [Verrucomicrobiota bacterium]MBT7699128.1 hypothetical protein [Verrucomicrobiota bacterium]